MPHLYIVEKRVLYEASFFLNAYVGLFTKKNILFKMDLHFVFIVFTNLRIKIKKHKI